MTWKQIGIAAGLAVLVALIFVAVATRPRLDTPSPDEVVTGGDPMTAPLMVHMLEAGVLDAGAEESGELVLTRSDDGIHVQVSERLLDRLGSGALERLEMLTPEETMTWSRYNRFLDRLHDAIVETLPEDERHEHHKEHHHDAP